MRRFLFVLLALVLAAGAAFAVLFMRSESGADAAASAPATAPTPELVARGEYLARAGNCMACHTDRGGAPWAGGRAIVTPFGTVYAGNLTPDMKTGLGAWSADDFWRALHHGRSRDGRMLYPAFPYTNYTQVTRADADAIHAYLRTLSPVQRANTPHDLRWPVNTQAALAVWRALYFRPASSAPSRRRAPSGTVVPTWCAGWATARPAMPRAMPWAPAT